MLEVKKKINLRCARIFLLWVFVIVLVSAITFTLITGGGLNILSYYDYEYSYSSSPIDQCSICVLEGNFIVHKVPFLYHAMNESSLRNIRISIRKCDRKISVERIVINDGSKDNIVTIDQRNKNLSFSSSDKNEYIDIINAIKNDTCSIQVIMYGVVEDEGKQTDFIVELQINSYKKTLVDSGWSNIMDSYLPPSLGGP